LSLSAEAEARALAFAWENLTCSNASTSTIMSLLGTPVLPLPPPPPTMMRPLWSLMMEKGGKLNSILSDHSPSSFQGRVMTKAMQEGAS
jgi:hypothetical protein